MNNKDEFFSQAFVIDLEATSLEPSEAEVIEFGYCVNHDIHPMEMSSEQRRSLDLAGWVPSSYLCKPSQPIPVKISAVTDISNTMVKHCPKFENFVETSLYEEVQALSPTPGVMVAHNIRYDQTLLTTNYRRQMEQMGLSGLPWLCTLELSKRLFRDLDDIESFGLNYLRYYFDLKLPDHIEYHRAGSDAMIAAKLLEVIIEFGEETGTIDEDENYLHQLLEIQNTPLMYKTMPYGKKYKGTPIEQVPGDYWAWAIDNTGWFDPESSDYDDNLVETVNSLLND